MLNYNNIKELLTSKGLKATTQRLIIYDVVSEMNNHPSADDIYSEIVRNYPSISLSTVYNTLDLFVENNIISTVKSDSGAVRYDAIQQLHHHLYCEETDKIEDYYNSELDNLLQTFFEKNKIINFEINEVKLQIKGKFLPKEK